MELLFFIGLYITAIFFLIKTNNSNKIETTKRIGLFIFSFTIKSMVLFCIAGCLFASIWNVEWNGQHHPHSMVDLLYIWFGLLGIIIGIIIGLILSSSNKTNLNKKLVSGSIIYLILIALWWFSIPLFPY